MVFRNMSPSPTTGNFPVAFTQCFTGNSGLRHEGNVSAFPSSSHSDPGEGVFSRLDYGSLALRPVALLALQSEQTGFLQPSRAFTSGLSTVWSTAPPPGITTVPTGQSARAGLSPARSSTSFTALPRPPSPRRGKKSSRARARSKSAFPSPWGEGGPRRALSPAGAGRVRGLLPGEPTVTSEDVKL
jgi:hypothetical protein